MMWRSEQKNKKNIDKNTWNIFGKLHQNLNLTCCHFGQQQEVFLGAVLVLQLEDIVSCHFQ